MGAKRREYYERAATKRLEQGRKKGGETGGRGRPKSNQDSSPVTLPESKVDTRDQAGKMPSAMDAKTNGILPRVSFAMD